MAGFYFCGSIIGMARNSNKQHLRIPPQNIESERALLGSIMLKPDVLNDIISIVSHDSFYAEKHRLIYKAMLELFGKSEPIDLLSMSSRLSEQNMLEQIGGRSYLAELVNSVPSSANAKHYADIVQKKAMMRNLIEAADYISELGYDEGLELEDLLEKAEKKIYEVTESPTLHKFVELKETLGEAWERLDHLHKSKDELRGIRTGFRELDDMLAGFQKSDLIILAARPSMGKTALALDIARLSATQHNTPVGIFSLEMSSQQLVDRMLAAESRVNAWKLRTGRLSTDTEFDQIRHALDNLSKAPIFIDDQPANNILKMRSVARRLKSERGVGLLIVDYLQLMVPTGSRGSDSLVQQVTEISRSLKTMARELNVPVLALSQLSRAVEQRRGRPRLSDLRDSGSLEQDSDVVMFIHRDDKYNEESTKPNIAEILIEKHRNGPTGKVELYFDEKRATFLSVDKSDFGEFEETKESDVEV
jgi:replicative DNA helicase